VIGATFKQRAVHISNQGIKVDSKLFQGDQPNLSLPPEQRPEGEHRGHPGGERVGQTSVDCSGPHLFNHLCG
jgi:hypothetical protein